MHDDLRTAIEDMFPSLRDDLGHLVQIPSVSAPGFDPSHVRASAAATADVLRRAGVEDVRLLEIAGAHPAVFGEIAAPDGAPTVLLYAHHDVQPAGHEEDWVTEPFTPVEKDGRLYGRGTSDDKCGIILHAAAVRAFRGRPPVGVKVLVEGEEEIGSLNLPAFLERYHEQLAADVIVIADSSNWRVGVPTFTTSLRGLVDCTVEVRALEHGIHSGMFGGAVPDALTALARLLATLHDEAGNVAVPGLVAEDSDPLDLDEDELRRQAGLLPGVDLIGSGELTSRMWTRPACSVLAIDAPRVSEAINALIPRARAKVSLRIAPGQDVDGAMKALVSHLEGNAPWGVDVTVTPGASGDAFALETSGPHFEAFREAFEAAWDDESVSTGIGGSIPFVAAFSELYPEATILLTGVGDPMSRAHGPNESVDLDEVRRGALAEAIALRLLAETGTG